jgi:mitochondrial distribution and morphology protein 31
VGDYLTQSAGVTVIFESAIVPKWKNGVISFRNVFVSRRPGQIRSSVKKGSSTDAAAVAATKHSQDATGEDVGNYTQFDVTINSVDVTLSFLKWWNGKGMLKDVEVKGIRGVVDRTSVVWSGEDVDPLSLRHEHNPGDFEIEHFKMEDLLVTIHQPGGFRPFSVSIYSCELPQLRKQFLFYDFLSANHMNGSFDGSLFTIHPQQVHGVMPDNRSIMHSGGLGEPSAWKKFSRLRIDGLKIDHLNRGDDGPFGWIYEGNVDIVADIMFPVDADDSIGKVMSDFYDKMEEAVTSNQYLKILESNRMRSTDVTINNTLDNAPEGHLTTDTHIAGVETTAAAPEPQPAPPADPAGYLVMDLRLHLNDVRAAVPFFPARDALGHSRAQSYINAALIRPIVAYINAKRTYIPISCRIVKRAADFDGAWSVFDCGLMDDLGGEVYSAFARDVEDQQSRVRRLKKVGFWTLSMFAHALLAGVAGDLM